MPTPSMEDYLERIYQLIEDKGYARVSDIAEHLDVHPSSVTKMVQKLDEKKYLSVRKIPRSHFNPERQKNGQTLGGSA